VTRRDGALALVLAGILGGCSPRTGQLPAVRPSPSSTPAATPSPTELPDAHVFVIVMENRTYDEAVRQPYTSRLVADYAVATNYHAVAHPSLPNYLALTAGSTFGITDDAYHRLPAGGIGAQLSDRGIPWRAYMEGMSRGCFDSPPPYALKHNPFAYYGGSCPSNVVPLTALDADLAGDTPRLAWITPDICHDGHDCSSRTADDFLAALVPRILGSAAWQRGGLLLITWDEEDGGPDNRVATIVAARGLTRHRTDELHDHYSLLATVEDRLGIARLGAAQQATALDELFK
jgi:phosphatidylinositol-3-phosphatase